MADPATIGLLLLNTIPFITRALSPELLRTFSGFVDELLELSAAHAAAGLGKETIKELSARLRAYAQNPTKAPENHDLQKAFYGSFLCATDMIYQVRLSQLGVGIREVPCLVGLRNHILEGLRSASLTNLSLTENEKDYLVRKRKEIATELRDYRSLSQPQLEQKLPVQPDTEVLTLLTSSARKRPSLEENSVLLVAHMVERSPWYADVSDEVKTIARNALLETQIAFFAEAVKSDQRVQAILTNEILASINIDVKGLVSGLRTATEWIKKVESELRELKNLVEAKFKKHFQVIDDSFLKNQEKESLRPFLTISVGDWPFVVQSQGIERDLTEEVTGRILAPRTRAAFQIIRGEPGSGKTTLLRQIGAKLVEKGCWVLEARQGAKFNEFQDSVEKLTNAAKARLFILIDDIYRDEDRSILVEILSDPGHMLPVTIIATTPSHEDRTREIRENNYLDILPPVTPDKLSQSELERLRRIPEVAKLSERKFKSLTKSGRMLVVMLQLSNGKPLDQILLDVAHRLRENFPETYAVWDVICTFGRWNFPVPESLLEKILSKPGFGQKLRHGPATIGSEGLVFPSDYPFAQGWTSGHQVIAETAVRVEFAGSLQSNCQAALQSADPTDSEHALFIGRMFHCLSSIKTGDWELGNRLLKAAKWKEKVQNLALLSPEAQADWALALWRLGEKDLAEKCLTSANPTSPRRASMVINLLATIGRFDEACRVAESWCESHPHVTFVRGAYLSLLGQRGSDEQVHLAIGKTQQWLSKLEHDEDTYVRGIYLGLVELAGSDPEFKQAIEETQRWLGDHDSDTNVRIVYLGVVGRERGGDQLEHAMKQTEQWLRKPEHANDAAVREAYVGLAAHLEDETQAEYTIALTEKWLREPEHDEESNVRVAYMSLLEKRGSAEQLAELISGTRDWLEGHPEAREVWTALIAMLIRQHQSPLSVEVTSAAIFHHPNDRNLAEHYLDLFASTDSAENISKMFAELLVRFPRDSVIALRYAKWLSEKEDAQASVKFDELIRKHPKYYDAYHAFGRHWLHSGNYEKARKQFELTLGLHRGHQRAHEGLAPAFHGLAGLANARGETEIAASFLKEAERDFKSAIHWAKVQQQPVAKIYASLSWFYLDQKHYEEAPASFDLAILENPDHFRNHEGRGTALCHLKRYPEALLALEQALEKAPSPLGPPASEEIPPLIAECKAQLSQ